MEAVFGVLLSIWGLYLIYATLTVVSKTKEIAYQSRLSADALSRIEDMLNEELSDVGHGRDS